MKPRWKYRGFSNGGHCDFCDWPHHHLYTRASGKTLFGKPVEAASRVRCSNCGKIDYIPEGDTK